MFLFRKAWNFTSLANARGNVYIYIYIYNTCVVMYKPERALYTERRNAKESSIHFEMNL